MPMQVGVGVATLVLQDRKLLMIERQGAHGAGKWSVPGGWMEKGETPFDAAVRECREETGVHVEPVAVVGVTNDIFDYDTEIHSVCFFVYCSLDAGMHQVATRAEPDKVRQVAWLTRRETFRLPLFKPLASFFASDLILRGNDLSDVAHFTRCWRD